MCAKAGLGYLLATQVSAQFRYVLASRRSDSDGWMSGSIFCSGQMIDEHCERRTGNGHTMFWAARPNSMSISDSDLQDQPAGGLSQRHAAHRPDPDTARDPPRAGLSSFTCCAPVMRDFDRTAHLASVARSAMRDTSEFRPDQTGACPCWSILTRSIVKRSSKPGAIGRAALMRRPEPASAKTGIQDSDESGYSFALQKAIEGPETARRFSRPDGPPNRRGGIASIRWCRFMRHDPYQMRVSRPIIG